MLGWCDTALQNDTKNKQVWMSKFVKGTSFCARYRGDRCVTEVSTLKYNVSKGSHNKINYSRNGKEDKRLTATTTTTPTCKRGLPRLSRRLNLGNALLPLCFVSSARHKLCSRLSWPEPWHASTLSAPPASRSVTRTHPARAPLSPTLSFTCEYCAPFDCPNNTARLPGSKWCICGVSCGFFLSLSHFPAEPQSTKCKGNIVVRRFSFCIVARGLFKPRWSAGYESNLTESRLMSRATSL